jgi:LysM repeat protein
MPERPTGTPRLLRSAVATSTLPLLVLGSAALAAPAAADAPRQALAPRSVTSVNIEMAQVRLSSASLASSLPAAFVASTGATQASRTASTHTVKAGDTLSGIAARNGIGLSTLLTANGLSSASVIHPGQTLKLSGTAGQQTAGSASRASAGNYTVKAGDTLSGIAARNGIGLSTLLTANGLSSASVIHPGQTLKLSGTASSSQGSAPGNGLVPDTFLHYTYPDHVVASANENKRALLGTGVPSRSQMQAIIADTARRMGVDPSLALAHSFAESSFNQTAVSPANAIGAMQVIPSSGTWASELVGRKLNLLDPYDNATAGVAIIRQLQRNAPSVDIGIAAYYQGLGGVTRNGMYPDTKRYVSKVKGYMQRF